MSSRALRIVLGILLVSWAVTAFTGVLFREEVVGDKRVCYYRDGTEITVKTVPNSDPCPVNN